MKKTNPYLNMTPNTLAAAAILQGMELQLKAAKVLLTTGAPVTVDPVAAILKTLNTPAAERLAAPPEPSTKGMDNFAEVPETTAKIVVAMSGASFRTIPEIAQNAAVSTETVRRYLYKVLLPNQMARVGTTSSGRSGYRKVIANTRKIE